MKNNRAFNSSDFLRLAGLLAMLVVLPAAAVQPEIVENSVFIGHNGNSPLVEISYTLTGEPAVVTVKIETNTLADASGDWVSIGGKGTGLLGGEANKVVYTLGEPVKAYWNPAKGFDGKIFDSGTVRATVTAWPTNTPPDYMVVDLATQDRLMQTRYYVSTNDFPGGFEDVQYKTTKLVMRKIPAKNVVWWMGSPTRIGDEGWDTVDYVPHKVRLTEDYYAGIYELTIGQLKSAEIYTLFDANIISKFENSNVSDLLPAERLGHCINELRGEPGSTKNSNETVYYNAYFYTGHSVASGSVIDKLRARTGLVDLDLPTEAQWEYAARAGANTALPWNMEYTEENTLMFACTKINQYTHTINNETKSGPSPVGTLKPNEWGLYDVLGNVSEICLDLPGYGTYLAAFKKSLADGWDNPADPKITEDPYGPKEFNYWRNMYRGGNWLSEWNSVNTYARSSGVKPNYTISGSGGSIGVRLFCPVAGNVK